MLATTKLPDRGTLAFYEEHAKEFCDSTVDLDLHQLYEPFLRQLPQGGRILDAGCGSGRDTKAFLELGYRVTSIDASPQMAELATVLTGQPCLILPFQEMDFRQEFDGIWACASLLHVPERDMSNVMDRLIKALKPEGTLYVSLKEGLGERTAEDGRFFSYYTEASFRQLLEKFQAIREIASWKTDDVRSRQHTGPWLNFLIRKIKC